MRFKLLDQYSDRGSGQCRLSAALAKPAQLDDSGKHAHGVETVHYSGVPDDYLKDEQ